VNVLIMLRRLLVEWQIKQIWQMDSTQYPAVGWGANCVGVSWVINHPAL